MGSAKFVKKDVNLQVCLDEDNDVHSDMFPSIFVPQQICSNFTFVRVTLALGLIS